MEAATNSSRDRSEALNVEEFDSALEARVVIGEWRELYNNVRRRLGLGLRTPAACRVEAIEQRATTLTTHTDDGRGKGVDESACDHCDWISRPTLSRGANPAPKPIALTHKLARLVGPFTIDLRPGGFPQPAN